VSGFLNFDEKIIATTIKLAHAKVSLKTIIPSLTNEKNNRSPY
jgi:hypothetical protein